MAPAERLTVFNVHVPESIVYQEDVEPGVRVPTETSPKVMLLKVSFDWFSN